MADIDYIYRIPDRKEPLPFDPILEYAAIEFYGSGWADVDDARRQEIREIFLKVQNSLKAVPVEVRHLNDVVWATDDEAETIIHEFVSSYRGTIPKPYANVEEWARAKRASIIRRFGNDQEREARRIAGWRALNRRASA